VAIAAGSLCGAPIAPLQLTHAGRGGMVSHMKTTLNIDEKIMRDLKVRSAQTGETMSHLVEAALRNYLRPQWRKGPLPPLPTFHGGKVLANVDNRDELYEAMES